MCLNEIKLKVVSFNIRYCDDKNGHSIAERAPRLNAAVLPYEADVIGFQEFTPAWEPFISEYFFGDYEFFNKYRAESNHESAPMLWRRDKYRCIDKGYFWLSDTPEVESRGWDEKYNCYRICQYAVLEEKMSDKRFTFMNTHFGFGDKGQSDSARLIYDYSKKISEYPTFITGDFNMLPTDVAYAVMCENFTDTNAATVNDQFGTFHNYTPQTVGKHIDYCFAGKGVNPVTQKIIKASFDGKYPSDHYGLYTELEI